MLNRKFYKKLIVYVLLVIFANNCSKNKNSNSSGVKITTKKTINVDSTTAQYLGRVYPLIASSTTNEYLALSNMNNPVGVVVIDYEGNFVAHYGSRGKGPTELLSARFFGFDRSNQINIYDKSLGLIKEFYNSTDSVSSYQSPVSNGVNISSHLLAQCDSSWVVGVTELNDNNRSMSNSSIIGKFDDTFKLQELFGTMDPYIEGHKSILTNTLISVDCRNDLIYTTHTKVPFIQIYDLNDLSRKHRIDHVPPSFKLSDEFIEIVTDMQKLRDFLINDQSSTIFLSHSKDYIILPFRNETSKFYETRNFNDREHFLAVFSKKNLEFVDEIPLDGAPLGATKEGYIITLVNDNPDNFEIKFLEVQDASFP